jgi:hypothetical protein
VPWGLRIGSRAWQGFNLFRLIRLDRGGGFVLRVSRLAAGVDVEAVRAEVKGDAGRELLGHVAGVAVGPAELRRGELLEVHRGHHGGGLAAPVPADEGREVGEGPIVRPLGKG